MTLLMPAETIGFQGYRHASGHREHTHLEDFRAYEVGAEPHGFSGHGWIVMETATGTELDRYALRIDALNRQDAYERMH